jgi:hypothetical protein
MMRGIPADHPLRRVKAQSATRRLWSGWAWLVPLAAIPYFAWLLRAFFLR